MTEMVPSSLNIHEAVTWPNSETAEEQNLQLQFQATMYLHVGVKEVVTVSPYTNPFQKPSLCEKPHGKFCRNRNPSERGSVFCCFGRVRGITRTAFVLEMCSFPPGTMEWRDSTHILKKSLLKFVKPHKYLRGQFQEQKKTSRQFLLSLNQYILFLACSCGKK